MISGETLMRTPSTNLGILRVRSLAKVTTGEYDAFLWVSAPDRSNKFLEAVNQEGSGLTMIDMNG